MTAPFLLSSSGLNNKVKTIFYTYSTILIVLSILPINGTNSILNDNYILSIRWDYIIHALIFVPLFPLYTVYFRKSTTNKKHQTINILLLFVFAILLEGIQYIIPYRSFNINDLVANGVGVVIGLGFIYIAKKKLQIAL